MLIKIWNARGLLLWMAFAITASPAPAASLNIERAAVQRVEDGHPVLPPDTFVAGELVHFSFHAQGFTSKENEVKLSFEARPVDAAGVPLVPAVASSLAATLTPEDKEWRPKLRGNFSLPGVLNGGKYRILLTLKDEQSGKTVTQELPFDVTGSAVESAGAFTVRNLAFYRTDEDERPLRVAAYRLSEEVHVRFRITGYGREKGLSDVVYGIAITDASGHAVFAEPAAAEDRSEDFYPKPFIPGLVSFSLQPPTPAGEYVLTVTASDKIGGQQAQARRTFRLE